MEYFDKVGIVRHGDLTGQITLLGIRGAIHCATTNDTTLQKMSIFSKLHYNNRSCYLNKENVIRVEH